MKRTKIQYYAAIEGEQEKVYLKHFQKLVNSCDRASYDININVKCSNGGGPLAICKNANRLVTFANKKQIIKEERMAAIFDYDFKEDFTDAIAYCELNHLMSAYSNVNFDLWLLLHKTYYTKAIANNDGYVTDIKKVFGVKGSIKSLDNIVKIVNSLTLDDVKMAIKNAQKIAADKAKSGEALPGLLTHYTQPYVQIHLFIAKILRDVGLL